MTCVLDPKRAACRLRSEENGTRRTPDLDDCRPNCVNIARTDHDIEHVLVQIERLTARRRPAGSRLSLRPRTARTRPPGTHRHRPRLDRRTARWPLTRRRARRHHSIDPTAPRRPSNPVHRGTHHAATRRRGRRQALGPHAQARRPQRRIHPPKVRSERHPTRVAASARPRHRRRSRRPLREDNGRLRERVAVYAQVIHELRTELGRRTTTTPSAVPYGASPPASPDARKRQMNADRLTALCSTGVCLAQNYPSAPPSSSSPSA